MEIPRDLGLQGIHQGRRTTLEFSSAVPLNNQILCAHALKKKKKKLKRLHNVDTARLPTMLNGGF